MLRWYWYLIDVPDWFKWFKICEFFIVPELQVLHWNIMLHKQRGENVEENSIFGGKYTPGHLAHGSSD